MSTSPSPSEELDLVSLPPTPPKVPPEPQPQIAAPALKLKLKLPSRPHPLATSHIPPTDEEDAQVEEEDELEQEQEEAVEDEEVEEEMELGRGKRKRTVRTPINVKKRRLNVPKKTFAKSRGNKKRKVDENIITAAGVSSSEESEEDDVGIGGDSTFISEQDELDGQGEEEEVDMLAEEDEDEEDEDLSSFSTSVVPTPLDYSRMTARQRAREGVDPSGLAEELQSLPMVDPSKKRAQTETELALKKSEQSRKRKNQADKKLEEEKQETINRLLKKQVGKSSNRKSAIGTEAEDDRSSKSKHQALAQPKSWRYIASIKGGEYKASLSAPRGWEARISTCKVVETIDNLASICQVTYPPPRPLPKTRMLKA